MALQGFCSLFLAEQTAPPWQLLLAACANLLLKVHRHFFLSMLNCVCIWNSIILSSLSVYLLSRLEIAKGDEQVKADANRIGNYANGQFPTDSNEFAKRIFYTVFMGSENR